MNKTKKQRTKKEHGIFKTLGYYTIEEEENFKKDIQAQRIEEDEELLNDNELLQRIYEDISLFYDDEKELLNKTIDNKILCIASMGLWNGRKTGYKILENYNLNEILQSFSCDEFKIYCDNYNIFFEGYHHDGKNYIEFREIKNMDNIDNLLNKIYNNETISRSLINYYTKPMTHYIKQIYGF